MVTLPKTPPPRRKTPWSQVTAAAEDIEARGAFFEAREREEVEALRRDIEQRLALRAEAAPPAGPSQRDGDESSLLRGAKSMGHGLLRATQGFWDLLDTTADLVVEGLGEVQIKDATGKIHRVGLRKPQVFRALRDMAEPPPDWTPRDLAEKIVSGFSGAPVEIATIMAMPGPNLALRMGALGALRGSREGPLAAGTEALVSAAMGRMLEAAGILRPLYRVPAMAAAGGTQAAAAGGGPEQIAESAAVMGGLGLLGGPGAEHGREKRLAREMKAAEKLDEQARTRRELRTGREEEKETTPPAHGLETEILHNQGRDLARYAVVELSDLTPSHVPERGFAPNERYPQGLQERRYESDRAEQAKVLRAAATYDPAYTVNTDPTLVNGPPAVTRDGVVLGGNSRVMTLDEVYRTRPEAAARYREALETRAPDFGLSAEEVRAFRRPVLVRVVDSSVENTADMQRRVRLYNEPPTQALDARAEGVSKARLMSDESLDVLQEGLGADGGKTLRDYLSSPRSRELVSALYRDGILERSASNRHVDPKTGLLTEDGKRLVEQVVRGRVYEDADFLATARPETLKKLDLSLPALARIKARGGAWDVTGKLREAVRLYTDIRARGFDTVAQYEAQGGLFGRDRALDDPVVRGFLEIIETKKPHEIRADFEDFARAAAADIPGQESFAFYRPETPAEALARIFDIRAGTGEASAWAKVAEAEPAPAYTAPAGVKEIRLPGPRARELVEEQLSDKKPAKALGERQYVLFTGGPPGAGKSSAAEKISEKAVVADPDIIKAAAGMEERAREFHEQSSEIAARVRDEAIDRGCHVIVDGLLSSFPKARAAIDRALEKGARVGIFFTNVDAETSAARSLACYLVDKAMGRPARAVPLFVSAKGYNHSLPTFLELWRRYRDDPRVDFRLVDNNIDGRKPRLVMERKEGQLKIYDKETLDNLARTPYHEIEGGKYERKDPIRPEDLAARAERIRSRAGLLAGDALRRRGLDRRPDDLRGQTRGVRRRVAPESPYEEARRLYGQDDAKVEEQLELFHRQAQQRLFDILDEAPAVSGARGDLVHQAQRPVRTLGSQFRETLYKELTRKGRIDLTGHRIESTEDLARLAEVYRNPLFETLRIFYIKDGRIVAHEGISSRLPGISSIFVEDAPKALYRMRSRMRRLGADGYYLLHNHPSGRTAPSPSDVGATRTFAQQVPGFLGHIIIDGRTFHELLPRPDGTLSTAGRVFWERRDPAWRDPLLEAPPAVPHPALGRPVKGPRDVAALARDMRSREGYATIIYLSAGSEVRAVQEVPVGLLLRPKQGMDFLRGRARVFGARDAVAYMPGGSSRLPADVAGEYIEKGALLDIVYAEGVRSAALEETGPVRRRGVFGLMEEEIPAWRVAEDPRLARAEWILEEPPAEWLRPEEVLRQTPAEEREIRFAGNLNLERIRGAGDIETLLRETEKRGAPLMDRARRGRISHQETRRLADAMGMSVEQLLARREGQAFNAEEALAARNLLVSSAARVVDLARKVHEGLATDLDRLAFRKALSTHYAIQAQVSGLTAEAGRALSAFRILAESPARNLKDLERVIDAAGGRADIDAMAEKLALLDSTTQVTATVRQAEKATRWDVFLEAWINGLLSNPVTHAVNMTSNALTALWMIPERMMAAGFARLLRTGDQGVASAEALAQAYGLVEGLRDGLRMARASWKTEGQTELDYMGKIEAPRRAISAEALELSGAAGRAADLLGRFVRIPGRALGAADVMWKAVGYRMELRAQALRRARAEGLRGDQAARRIRELLENPPEPVRLAAVDAARYQTYTKQLSGISVMMQAAAARHPALRLVVPFVRTPANIARFAFERTPLAPLSAAVRADIARGGAARDLALGRMALGGLVMAAVAALAAEGVITGQGPADRATRRALRRTGWQPYSVRIGRRYYSYARLEPLGALLGLAADAAELLGEVDDMDADAVAAACIMSVSRNITSKTYLRGLSDLFNALAEPERYGARYVQRFAGSLVPAGTAQAARILDPVYRDVHGILDQYRSRIPGLSRSLPARRDLWGRKVVLPPGWGPDIISPIYTSLHDPEPVDRVIVENKIPLGMPAPVIDGVPLTPHEYEHYVRLAGNELKDPATGLGCLEALNALVKNPLFRRLTPGPEGGKAAAVRRVVERYRRMARRRMRDEHRELDALARELAMERAQGR